MLVPYLITQDVEQIAFADHYSDFLVSKECNTSLREFLYSMLVP